MAARLIEQAMRENELFLSRHQHRTVDREQGFASPHRRAREVDEELLDPALEFGIHCRQPRLIVGYLADRANAAEHGPEFSGRVGHTNASSALRREPDRAGDRGSRRRTVLMARGTALLRVTAEDGVAAGSEQRRTNHCDRNDPLPRSAHGCSTTRRVVSGRVRPIVISSSASAVPCSATRAWSSWRKRFTLICASTSVMKSTEPTRYAENADCTLASACGRILLRYS